MKDIKPKKRDLLIASIFLLIGFLLSNIFQNKGSDTEYKTAASELAVICSDSVTSMNELYDTCNLRYSSFYNCVADLENCDFDEATAKGQEYNETEEEIEKGIEEQTKRLKELIETVEAE